MATVLPPKTPRFLTRLFSPARATPDERLVGPIRGELLGAERLAEHARQVARKQRAVVEDRRQRHRPLLRRLDETRQILDDAREQLTEASDQDIDISPAGEWLLDNFYVVQEHIREIRASMPKRYYRELPKLALGSLAGYPRVYELAIELIAHTEGHIGQDNIDLFTREFQRVTPLSLGELWAIPTMLRLGLIENIRRMTLRVLQRQREVREADQWSERIRQASTTSPQAQTAVLNEFVAKPPELTATFVTRFLQQIRAFQTGFTPLVWLEQWIAEEGMPAEDAVARTNQRLALTQVMMANSITSLRAIARLDWKSFVEAQSVTERTLRRDPSGFYAQTTFGTRDHYRHVVEQIAKYSGKREDEVAALAVELAKASAGAQEPRGVHERRAHVGYWLVDEGRETLEVRAGYRIPFGERVHRFVVQQSALLYFGAIVLGTLAALTTPLVIAGAGVSPLGWSWAHWLVALLALIPASEIAIGAINQLVTVYMPPRTLPKLEMREQGIPAAYLTVVVVPTLLPSVDSVEEALEHLEVQFLANRDPNLRFALLSDFTDAPTETTPNDDAILRAAVQGVESLNREYGTPGEGGPFYLFHRPREWNPVQGVWMAWERKRGKLGQFNRLLRGEGREAFSTIVGDVTALYSAKYVITLDSDTVLSPDAAHLLIGAMAHPLNRAEYEPSEGRVVRGYGILQPRIGISLTSAHKSRFASIHSGHPGVDPYTTAVSDVYQDLFAEGSYTGKGIYDVDAFERAVQGRFPENTLLSHDLIEGAYARAGLLTDVELFDDYPTRYLTFTRRKHRWIRGDWQLLRWLGRRVPGPGGTEPNRLSAISRWKIFDNLRRSVFEIAQVLLLIAGWTILPGSPLSWTLLVLASVAFPWVFSTLLAIIRPPRDQSWIAYYAAVWGDVRVSAQQLAIGIVFLPHQAWVSADGIVRTLHRLFVSRRNLLEWQTASQTERVTASSSRELWVRMRPAVLLTAAMAVLVLWRIARGDCFGSAPGCDTSGDFALLFVVIPLLGVWLGSPRVAHALSAPALRPELSLTALERPRALRYALLQWRYFDQFVSEKTHWLAPDNYQETPEPVVAMRTSPTNVGLQLLSTVSAHDLGFLPRAVMIERLENVLRTLERLRRYRGHFYNWYDLNTLAVLEPAYVSTVDSGNFAGHMVALKQACLEYAEHAPSSGEPSGQTAAYLAGMSTALQVARDQLRDLGTSGDVADPHAWQALRALNDSIRAVQGALDEARHGKDTGNPAATFTAAAGELANTETLAAQLEDMSVGAATARAWILWARELGEGVIQEMSATETVETDQRKRLETIAQRAQHYVDETDFSFLFDNRRKLFSIGFQVATAQLDNSYYDLLASESRLASFLAIAKGDIPLEHWFRLGRTLTQRGTAAALVSWSGSMFEYLMPALVMRAYPFTLLDQTYRSAVRRHMDYGEERNVPWGISESAYNVRDRESTYQYKAFGVPDLALKRGLRKDLVIAPYASMLAVQVEPHHAMTNLAALEAQGALGTFGFREGIDYTRPNPGSDRAVVMAYFAHHTGMGLVALHNALQARRWQERFHAHPIVRAAELVLFERIPRRLVMQEPPDAEGDESLPGEDEEQPAVRVIESPDTPSPHIALLAGSPYAVMLTNAGGGYSRHEHLAITRWRNDGTTDATGQWCYVRDVATNRVWSAAHQPTCTKADWYRAIFATDRATFHRRDGQIETQLDITVVPEDAAEVRRVTVTNHSQEPRVVELTSYGEVVLTRPDADRAHPAFHNLFVETEWLANLGAILASRRPRASNEHRRWCVHVVASGKERVGDVTFETDRAKFVGRGRSTRNPTALDSTGELSGTVGAVLDPIMSLRVRVRLAPGQLARVAFTTLLADTRERAIELADRYNDPYAAQRSLDLSWTHAQVELRDLGMTPAEAALYQQLAGYLFHSYAPLRAPQHELNANRGHQELLWSIGVSGDWPILLAMIDSPAGLPSVRQLLRAHQYLRLKGMTVDLVFLNTHPPTYLQELGDALLATVMASSEATTIDQPGGVFIRRRELLSEPVLAMLRATARVHVVCDGLGIGKLLEAMEQEVLAPLEPGHDPLQTSSWVGAGRRSRASGLFALTQPPLMPPLAMGNAVRPPSAAPIPRITRPIQDPRRLELYNLIGGINREGEYEMRLDSSVLPPAPWSNVVANEDAGFVVTERGGGFTWAENSYFYRLTPWFNDPVSDPCGEALYLTDDESGATWSATPAPVNHDALFTVRHAHGCTVFAQEHNGIASTLVLGVPERDPVKLSLLRIENRGEAPRKLRITSYVEWALGALREHTQHQVRTWIDHGSGALCAQNTFDIAFADAIAFSFISEPLSSYTGDRREFIGRNGTLERPAALRRPRLNEATGAGLDPCAALQATIELEPGETKEVAVLLGATRGEERMRAVIEKYGAPGATRAALDANVEAWRRRLSVVTVRTPSREFDAMANGWLLYQALACRIWGRSALYQSSGAFGFRDQLQDVLALVHSEPQLARSHILRATARQFVDGDVQHWWHPHTGRGVRTKFSDDLAWLPYVVEGYVAATGDDSVLREEVPFLTMRQLGPDEHEIYDLPHPTAERASVYEHCLRALRRAATKGSHGLPLIGIGDWNDGMNRVGHSGRGESVWLAWFLSSTMRKFAPICAARGDTAAAQWLEEQAAAYVDAVERTSWDGDWYRRAYFDDGTPLGSKENIECRIDAIAQSWSVISGAGRPERQARAMQSTREHLVDENARLIRLLVPAFDTAPYDPGYIKGYLPGVRENGAQYTHAALWTVLATAMRGDGDEAFRYFQMINPLMHSRTPEEVATYMVEPYVVAADVYTAQGHVGRGGWTWYTGSASWMYRVAVEAIVGVRREGTRLVIDPCVPKDWKEFGVEYRFGESVYAVTIRNPSAVNRGVASIAVDGARVEAIVLKDDGARHEVVVEMGGGGGADPSLHSG